MTPWLVVGLLHQKVGKKKEEGGREINEACNNDTGNLAEFRKYEKEGKSKGYQNCSGGW